MKNTITLLLLAISCTAFAQNKPTKELIAKKWIVDTEATAPFIKTMVEERPDIANLDTGAKQAAIKTALEQVSNYTLDFKNDNTLQVITAVGTKNRTWQIKEDEIVSTGTDNKETIYKVIDITSNKLQIKIATYTLVFKPII